jgi:hypothetical protein
MQALEDNSTLDTQYIDERIKEIDKEIEHTKGLVKLFDNLKSLVENDSYKAVVEQAYFEDEGKRLSNTLLSPNFLKRDQLDSCVEKMAAIRHFKTFMGKIQNDVFLAAENLGALENERDSLLSNTGEEE